MTATDHPLLDKGRIVEAHLWDRDYLDLVEPASIAFGGDGRGEFAFGAVDGDMELEFAPSAIFFTWQGFDEMDDVSGSGSAQLDDDGVLESSCRSIPAMTPFSRPTGHEFFNSLSGWPRPANAGLDRGQNDKR